MSEKGDAEVEVDVLSDDDVENNDVVAEKVWGDVEVIEKTEFDYDEGDSSDDLDDKEIDKFLEKGVVFSPVPFVCDVDLRNLEEVIDEEVVHERWKPEDKRRDNEFYKTNRGTDDFYDLEAYDEKSKDDLSEKGVEYGVLDEMKQLRSFTEIEDERRGGRSILEISGFRDEEAEKKRKEKREGNFI